MFVADLIIAFVVALFFSLVLVSLLGWRRPGAETAASLTTMWFVLILLLAATWAGGVWLRPLPEAGWAADWVPFILAGMAFALLLAAIAPPPPPRRLTRREAELEAEAEVAAAAGITLFVWLLLAFLALAIVANYVLPAAQVA